MKSNIRALVQLNLLNSLQKEIKCSTRLTLYLLFPTRLIKSIEHDHLCKILYLFAILFEVIL